MRSVPWRGPALEVPLMGHVRREVRRFLLWSANKEERKKEKESPIYSIPAKKNTIYGALKELAPDF
jgi:hypothetical protein